MEILTDAHKIEEKLIECINKYENISMSVAWASSRSNAFKELVKNKNKIQTSTVGLHFYQTDPEFIEVFLNDRKLQFYKKNEGIFHPKIYLFWNNEIDWICLSGSANFTKSALSINDEIMILFNSNDNISFKDIKKIIDNYYNKSILMTKKMLENYIIESKNNKKDSKDNFKINKLIKDMNWDEYYSLIKEKGKYLEDRIKLLEKANQYFKNNTFALMTELQRKNIAGVKLSGDGIKDWHLFGAMNRTSLSKNEILIDILEKIYLYFNNKEITRDIFIKFVKDINHKGIGISSITRLLAIKYPDKFFCLTSNNELMLLEYFNIKNSIRNESKKEKKYERYWDEIIEPISKFNSNKMNEHELKIWKTRAAMMDSLFYSE